MSLHCTAIAEDGHMQTLKQTILVGWPDNRADVNTDIASYFSMRDDLAVHGGLIFRGECVIVPQGMRKHINKRLHLSHHYLPGRIQHGAMSTRVRLLARNGS